MKLALCIGIFKDPSTSQNVLKYEMRANGKLPEIRFERFVKNYKVPDTARNTIDVSEEFANQLFFFNDRYGAEPIYVKLDIHALKLFVPYRELIFLIRHGITLDVLHAIQQGFGLNPRYHEPRNLFLSEYLNYANLSRKRTNFREWMIETFVQKKYEDTKIHKVLSELQTVIKQ